MFPYLLFLVHHLSKHPLRPENRLGEKEMERQKVRRFEAQGSVNTYPDYDHSYPPDSSI